MADQLYTGDGIEAYEPAGVSGGISRLPDQWQTNQFPLEAEAVRDVPWLKRPASFLRRQSDAKIAALEAEVQRLEAENQRLATLLADAENIVRDPYAVQSHLKEGKRLRELWKNALRGGDGRPR